MATQQIDGSAVTATSTANNGGTMVSHGSSSNLNVSSPAPGKVGVFASTVVDTSDVDPIVSGYPLAHSHTGPLMKGITSELAGASNSAISSVGGNPDNVRSIHQLEVLRTTRTTTALRANAWDEVNGVWESGYPVTAVDTLAADDAANPTRAVPGSLNYLSGAPTATSVNYSPKNT